MRGESRIPRIDSMHEYVATCADFEEALDDNAMHYVVQRAIRDASFKQRLIRELGEQE